MRRALILGLLLGSTALLTTAPAKAAIAPMGITIAPAPVIQASYWWHHHRYLHRRWDRRQHRYIYW